MPLAKRIAIRETMKAYADSWLDWYEGSGLRDLNFRSSVWLTPDDAADVMATAVPHGYNEFHADQIRDLPHDCLVQLAREGSVCIYVSRPIIGAGRIHDRADEWSVTKDGGETRIWWN